MVIKIFQIFLLLCNIKTEFTMCNPDTWYPRRLERIIIIFNFDLFCYCCCCCTRFLKADHRQCAKNYIIYVYNNYYIRTTRLLFDENIVRTQNNNFAQNAYYNYY